VGIVTVADERTPPPLGNDLEGKPYTTVGDQVRAKEVAKNFYISLTLCGGKEKGVSELSPEVQPFR
jgi:hypothetical protein